MHLGFTGSFYWTYRFFNTWRNLPVHVEIMQVSPSNSLTPKRCLLSVNVSFLNSLFNLLCSKKKEQGMPWRLSSSPGGRGWGNRPDASFLHCHLFFLEVRQHALSQTVCGGLGDVRQSSEGMEKGDKPSLKISLSRGACCFFIASRTSTISWHSNWHQ